MDFIQTITAEPALEGQKERLAQQYMTEYRSRMSQLVERADELIREGDYPEALEVTKKIIDVIDESYAKVDKIPVTKWTNAAMTLQLSAVFALVVGTTATAIIGIGETDLAMGATVGGATGAASMMFGPMYGLERKRAAIKELGKDATPADKNFVIGNIRADLRKAKTTWENVKKRLEQQIADDAAATEGMSAKSLQNIAKRRTENESIARRYRAWDGKVQEEVGRVLTEVIKASQSQFKLSQYPNMTIKCIANSGLSMARTLGRELNETSIFDVGPKVMPKEDDEDVYGKTYDAMARCTNALAAVVRHNLAGKTAAGFQLDKLFYVTTSCNENDEEYFEEQWDSASVMFVPRKGAGSIIAEHTKSFDSFIEDVNDYALEQAVWNECAAVAQDLNGLDAAIESDGEKKKNFGDKARSAGALLVALGFVGVTVALCWPLLVVSLALAIPMAIVNAVKNKKNANEIRHMQENPSDAEKASLEVFETKYASQMAQFANSFVGDFNRDIKPLYDKMGLKVTPAAKPSGSGPYSKMVIPMLTIKWGTYEETEGARDFRNESHTKMMTLVSKYNDISSKKFDGNVKIYHAFEGDGITLICGFDYVSRDGIILPGLK